MHADPGGDFFWNFFSEIFYWIFLENFSGEFFCAERGCELFLMCNSYKPPQ